MKRIIGLSGRAGSGKDSAASILVAQHGYTRCAFADAVKDSLALITGWSREALDGFTPQSREWRETVDQWWSARLGIPHLTPRYLMQRYATEAVRDALHSEMWIAALERRVLASTTPIVISDCRFANEMRAVRQWGGIVVRITRGSIAEPLDHRSEREAESEQWDYTIANDGSLAELDSALRDLLVRIDL